MISRFHMAMAVAILGLTVPIASAQQGVIIKLNPREVTAQDRDKLLGKPGMARIVGGSPSAQGKWPFQAFVQIETTGGFSSCGGSLVHPNWILTAAHCVHPETVGTVVEVLVLVDRADINNAGTGQIRTVSEVILHPTFTENNFNSDIALLRLAQPITTVATVSLTDNASTFAPGVIGTVIGYGTTSEGGMVSDQLLEVDVPIVSDAACAAIYGNYDADVMFGAGTVLGGKDSCQGDSGGPFLVPDGNGCFVQAGIVSFGDGCARPNVPGIYAEVLGLMPFISLNSTNEIVANAGTFSCGTGSGGTGGGNTGGGSSSGGGNLAGGVTAGGNSAGGNTAGGSSSGAGGNSAGGNTGGGSSSGGGNSAGGNTGGGSSSGAGGNSAGGNTAGGSSSAGANLGGGNSGGSSSGGGNSAGGNSAAGNSAGGSSGGGSTGDASDFSKDIAGDIEIRRQTRARIIGFISEAQDFVGQTPEVRFALVDRTTNGFTVPNFQAPDKVRKINKRGTARFIIRNLKTAEADQIWAFAEFDDGDATTRTNKTDFEAGLNFRR